MGEPEDEARALLRRAQDRIRSAIDESAVLLLDLSHEISADPELAWDEHRAAERVAARLQQAGFAIEKGAYGLPTAVEAVYGEGDVRIVIVCEYDALPETGHACGHNIIAASAVGAALALAAADLRIQVVLLGTPAEESGGGKVALLERGAWDQATCSLMLHPCPWPQPAARGFTSHALESIRVEFGGRASHAANAPHHGINAADAVTLTQVGIGLLRQQLARGIVVSSCVVDAGRVPNVIPERGCIDLEIRGTDLEVWTDARRRVRDVARGAALATGCTLEITELEVPYEPFRTHDGLAKLWDEVITREIGRKVSPPDQDFGGASTDMGNVSQFLAAIHPLIEVRGSTGSLHTADFARAARAQGGDEAVLDGALALALTIAEAVTDPDVRADLIRRQRERQPYRQTVDASHPTRRPT